jgi:hypothetical protein
VKILLFIAALLLLSANIKAQLPDSLLANFKKSGNIVGAQAHYAWERNYDIKQTQFYGILMAIDYERFLKNYFSVSTSVAYNGAYNRWYRQNVVALRGGVSAYYPLLPPFFLSLGVQIQSDAFTSIDRTLHRWFDGKTAKAEVSPGVLYFINRYLALHITNTTQIHFELKSVRNTTRIGLKIFIPSASRQIRLK